MQEQAQNSLEIVGSSAHSFQLSAAQSTKPVRLVSANGAFNPAKAVDPVQSACKMQYDAGAWAAETRQAREEAMQW
jgi:hypothetical protein